MTTLTWTASALFALCALPGLTGCGDDVSGTPDGGVDAPDIDAPPDGPPSSYVPPTPFAIPLSAAGPDQLMSVTPGPSGSFYAAGFAAADLAGVRTIVVVKLTATGALDTTFGGGDGIASTTVAFAGSADEIDVATQSDGKIVVSATVAAAVANPDDAGDRDVAVLRLESDGDLDATFGVAGVSVISWNTSYLDTTPDPDVVRGRDGVRGLVVGPDDQLFLYGYQRGEGLVTGGATPRIDTEFTVARLTAGGLLDASYGTAGKHLLDLYSSNTHSDATPRGINVLADGSVIANGYANTAGIGAVQAVLYRLTPAGALDANFATGGFFHETVLTAMTEIYGVAIHGTAIVTAGYGREAQAGTNDWVSMKFDVATGVRDLTFGGATAGAVLIDPSGMMLGSNCRSAVGLPDGSTVLIGSTGPNNLPAQDAAFAVLTSAGVLDPAYGDGVHTYQFGSNGSDQFWGGAVSGGKALIVGWKGGGTAPTAALNDDAYAILLTQP